MSPPRLDDRPPLQLPVVPMPATLSAEVPRGPEWVPSLGLPTQERATEVRWAEREA